MEGLCFTNRLRPLAATDQEWVRVDSNHQMPYVPPTWELPSKWWSRVRTRDVMQLFRSG